MHPLICDIGGFPLKTYGLMITIGFAAGILLAMYRAKRKNLDTDEVMNLATIIIIAAILGSRILYVMVNPAEYIQNPLKIFYIHEGGLVFLGGLLLVIPVVSYYLIHYKMNYLQWADLLFPSVPLGHIFGRLGCFMNGCCYGKPTDSSFGVVFPSIGDGIAYLPTQLFESLASLIILGLLLYIDRIKKSEGWVFAAYILLYSVWRFIIEFFRGDDRGAFVLGLPISQLLSFIGIFVGIAFMVYLLKTSNKNMKKSRKQA
jgi:phosphatidylglycerol:prolipoprotein diacylglycerol transferase